jgi:hypothetical protein
MSIDFWGDMTYLIFGPLAILKIFAESTEVMELKMTAEKFIENHPSFTTGEFADALQKGVPGIGRSTIYSILKKKCDSGEISRVSRGRFVHSARKDYSYELSETAKDIVALIRENYPLVEFQVWELYQMNEFVNHLLAKNTIFMPSLRAAKEFGAAATITTPEYSGSTPQRLLTALRAKKYAAEKRPVSTFSHRFTGRIRRIVKRDSSSNSKKIPRNLTSLTSGTYLRQAPKLGHW